ICCQISCCSPPFFEGVCVGPRISDDTFETTIRHLHTILLRCYIGCLEGKVAPQIRSIIHEACYRACSILQKPMSTADTVPADIMITYGIGGRKRQCTVGV